MDGEAMLTEAARVVSERRMAYGDPAAFQAIIDAIVELTVTYLSGQIEHGVDAVQLFDAGFGKLGWNVHERSYGMQLLEVLQHKPQLCDTAGQCTMSTFNQNDQTS